MAGVTVIKILGENQVEVGVTHTYRFFMKSRGPWAHATKNDGLSGRVFARPFWTPRDSLQKVYRRLSGCDGGRRRGRHHDRRRGRRHARRFCRRLRHLRLRLYLRHPHHRLL